MPLTKEEKDRALAEVLNSLVEKEESDKADVIKALGALADDLDKHTRNGKIADLTFASSGIVATGLTIAGVATAPFTFGTSLGLTIGGLALGVSSGAGTIGNSIVGRIIKSKTFEKAQTAKDKYFETSNQLIKIAKVLNESGSNEILFADLTSERFSSEASTSQTKSLALRSTVGGTGQCLRVAAVASAIATREVIDATTKTMAGVLKTGLMAAKVAGAVISTLSVPLDIYTIFVNSKDIHNKTPAQGAQEIRMALEGIRHLKMFKDKPSTLQITSDRKEPDFLERNQSLSLILAESEALKKLLYCTNCFTKEADVIILPCGHVTCCSACMKYFRRCSICKGHIRDVVGNVPQEVLDSLAGMFDGTSGQQDIDTDWVILDEEHCFENVLDIARVDDLDRTQEEDTM